MYTSKTCEQVHKHGRMLSQMNIHYANVYVVENF